MKITREKGKKGGKRRKTEQQIGKIKKNMRIFNRTKKKKKETTG